MPLMMLSLLKSLTVFKKLDHKRLGMHVKIRQENACEVIKLEGNATDDVITDALAAARSQSPSNS